MPAAVGAVVAGVFGATAGAVATAAVTGAIAGAVIGAVTALVTGGNVFKGALKGAAIGGVTAGVFKGVSIASTGASSTASGSAAVGTRAGAGFAAGKNISAAPEVLRSGASKALTDAGTKGLQAIQSVPVPAAPSSGILSGAASTVPSTQSAIYAGMGEGFASGLGAVGAEMIAGDREKDIAEFEADQIQKLRSQNVPGKFESQVAYMNLPNWWDEHLNPNVNTSGGLLATN